MKLTNSSEVSGNNLLFLAHYNERLDGLFCSILCLIISMEEEQDLIANSVLEFSLHSEWCWVLPGQKRPLIVGKT